MGSADVVPGVSGGTIALVLGIYERLVGSIRYGSSALGSLIKGDLKGSKANFIAVEWGFLLLLLAGIITAVLSLARFIETQLEEQPVILAAAFFGLVLGSVVVALGMIRERRRTHIGVILAVGLVLFFLLGLGSDQPNANPSLPVFFGSGALAITAMILPGISGSLILVLVGMYDPVLGAVNGRDILAVGLFVTGAVVGLALFSQLLHLALKRAHDMVLAILIGLMSGSLRILWPWPDGVSGSTLEPPDAQLGYAMLAALLGFAFVLLIARMALDNEA